MIVVAMAQILMSFNVNALPVSIEGIVAGFDTPPSIVVTAIITYSLFVAGFVMLGAKDRQDLRLAVRLSGDGGPVRHRDADDGSQHERHHDDRRSGYTRRAVAALVPPAGCLDICRL
jgi:hypothetical protein